jgi:stage V sporulation protein D (sporulation-specific penicillin-binding protein)
MGFAPYDDPQLACLVMIAEPKGAEYFGSQVAAPVFKAIALDTLRYLNVPERPGLEKPKSPFIFEEPKLKLTIPSVVNYPVEDAKRVLSNSGLTVQVQGGGNIVYNQVPKGGAEVLSGTTVILNLNPPNAVPSDQITVPDMKGLTIKEAGGILEKLGLHLNPSGSGIAVGQKEVPGAMVPKGTIITVDFQPRELHD